MSMHDELDFFDEATDEGIDEKPKQPTAALPIASLALCLVGAFVGYYFVWLIGGIMLIASIVCGAIALRRRAPYRWAAIAGIALSVIALIFAAAVISVIFYQMEHMEELLAAA